MGKREHAPIDKDTLLIDFTLTTRVKVGANKTAIGVASAVHLLARVVDVLIEASDEHDEG